MKRSSTKEADMLGLINDIQAHLITLDKKLDTLIVQTLPSAKPSSTPTVDRNRPDHRNKERVMYSVICADCKKECSIPFKPREDRAVYCQDCFSRRKVITLSKIGIDVKPAVNVPAPEVKKKKAAASKKTVAKKKTAPKKK